MAVFCPIGPVVKYTGTEAVAPFPTEIVVVVTELVDENEHPLTVPVHVGIVSV
jgi:hypothetical protein